MELVSEAIAFAVKVHDGMRRKKSDLPYIVHPMEAALMRLLRNAQSSFVRANGFSLTI